MLGMGLMGLALLLAFPPLPSAGAVPPSSGEETASSGAFSIKYFGEDPDQDMTIDPDTNDYQESSARLRTQYGNPTVPPSDLSRRPEPSRRPEGGAKPKPSASQRSKSVPIRSWIRRSPRSGSVAVPRRESPRRFSPPPVDLDAQDSAEGRLRSSMEADAKRYSLWSSLSTPLLMPADDVAQIPPDEAKTLARSDYETHILGRREKLRDAVAGVRTASAGPGALLRRAVVRPPKPLPPAPKPRGLFVTVELDISRDPKSLPEVLAGLAARTGFSFDKRFAPTGLTTNLSKVAVRGWLPAKRLGEVLRMPGVNRVDIERVPGKPSMRDGARTEVLVGLRMPPDRSPAEALREAVDRLKNSVGFRLDRQVGYQRIPGTSRMVLLAAGSVPVRKLGALMSDPGVVKVAPLPKKKAARRGGLGSRVASGGFFLKAAQRHPYLLLTIFLLLLSFFPAFRPRSRSRYPWRR